MRRTWQGWSSRSDAEGAQDAGWVELSRVLRNGMPKISYFPEPRFEQIRRMPEDPLNLTEIQMVVHMGTHLDAPCHFVADGPSIDEVPLDRFHGTGVVWSMGELAPHEVIGVDRLEAAAPEVGEDEIVLLDTGWAQHFGTVRYDEHPSLSPDAAQWLVDRRVKLVGLDVATPDMSPAVRPHGFDWPVHQILLSNGVLIGEHLDGLTELAGERVDVLFLPLRIAGADGGPSRALARRRTTDDGGLR